MKLPEFISVTDLCSFYFCPKQVYLNKVKGLKTPINKAMFKGSMKHKAFEIFSNAESVLIPELTKSTPKEKFTEDFANLTFSNLKKVFIRNEKTFDFFDLDVQDMFKSAYSLISSEISSRSSAIHNFARNNNIFGEELKEKFFPKILSEKRFSSKKLRLRGNIDRVIRYEDSLVPIEFKSGKLPLSGVFNTHRLQVGAYCMILDDVFNLSNKVNEGFVAYIDHGKSRKVVVNTFLEQKVLSCVDGVFSLFELDEPPLCSGKGFCSCEIFETKNLNI